MPARQEPFDSALFDRYFQVLSQRYGSARARVMLRGLSRRFGRSFDRSFRATGSRTASPKTKRTGSPSVPTNAGIREQVTKQVGKQTPKKKKS